MVFNLKWLLVFCASLVGIGICGALGLLHKLWETDSTMISYTILVLYLIVSPFVGWLTACAPSRIVEAYRGACRFVPELMTGLGMLGTVIGFLMMLGPTFGGLDAGNVKAMQTALGHMAGRHGRRTDDDAGRPGLLDGAAAATREPRPREVVMPFLRTAFLDLLFNALLLFVCLFALAFMQMRPVQEGQSIEAKAELMLEMTWPDGSLDDVDLVGAAARRPEGRLQPQGPGRGHAGPR